MMKKQKKVRRGNALTAKDWRGYVFIAPIVILFSIFLLYSFYFLVKYSFYRVTITMNNPTYVGMQNFALVFKDKQFWRGLINNIVLGSFTVFVSMTLGFLVSVFLMFRFHGKRMLHGLFFFPTMLPMALLATVFSTMLEYQDGTINQIFRAVGLEFMAKRWLITPHLAYMSVLSVSIFLLGLSIMYYSSGLSTLNKSVFEAALLDGANLRQMLFLIIYPLLKNTHYTVILSMILGTFREFERVYLLTNSGPGGLTEITGTYIFNYSRSAGSNLGMVCAASLLILAIAFGISYLQIRFSDKK